MQAGRLNSVIEIQQLTAGQDALGQPVQTWTAVATVRADVRDLSGREFFSAQAAQSGVTAKIRIRYRADVTAAMRAVAGTKIYNIQAVLDTSGKKRELTLMCSTGENNG